MKTISETTWKRMAMGLLVAVAALAVHMWQTRAVGVFDEAQTRAAVAQMQQQAQGNGAYLMAKNVPVPCFW